MPEKIHIILGEIFRELSNDSYFKNLQVKPNQVYNLRYKKVDYQMYFKAFGSKKDKLMVSTIYPINDGREIRKLQKIELKLINNELGLYKNCG